MRHVFGYLFALAAGCAVGYAAQPLRPSEVVTITAVQVSPPGYVGRTELRVVSVADSHSPDTGDATAIPPDGWRIILHGLGRPVTLVAVPDAVVP